MPSTCCISRTVLSRKNWVHLGASTTTSFWPTDKLPKSPAKGMLGPTWTKACVSHVMGESSMHHTPRLSATCECHCTQFPSVRMMHWKFSLNTVQLSSPNYAANGFCPIASASALRGMIRQQAQQWDAFILQRCWTQYARSPSRYCCSQCLGSVQQRRTGFTAWKGV